MRFRSCLPLLVTLAWAAPAHAQFGPSFPGASGLPGPTGIPGPPELPKIQELPGLPTPGALLGRVRQDVETITSQAAQRLEDARQATVRQLVRDHPREIALDPQGFPARAGEVVVDDPSDALISAATAKGYHILERGDLLGVGFVRLATPDGRSLSTAIRELRKLGAREVSADQLHAPSGKVPARPAPPAAGNGPLVGVIDGGVAGATLRAGFATGAPRNNDHGTAVASLITGAGAVRGGLPGARIASADVYGSDPAGGSATAIAKAIGWMVQNRVGVVTISLVGPGNPLLGRVVAAAQARGLVIVAAVGNDGPAAPPAYPASYPGVIAVTGIDGRGRPLIEAGRATHLDYAAPGADMLAMAASGTPMRVRGTSFAAPLAAAVIARFYSVPDAALRARALTQTDAAARKAGPRFGRGVLCETCRTPAP